MRALYRHFTPRRFHCWVPPLSAAGDFIILFYLYCKGSDYDYFSRTLDQMNMSLPEDLREQLFGQYFRMLVFGIVLVALFHALIYWLWHKQKSYARKYLTLYMWVSGPLCLLAGLSMLASLSPWGLAFLFCGLNFLFIAFGLRRFPYPGS